MTPWALKCHGRFFAQFSSILYAPCPTVDFLIQLTRHHLEAFCVHLKTQAARTVSVVLDDDDWIEMRDYVAYATQEILLQDWLTPVFLHVIRDAAISVIDAALLTSFIGQQRGVRHVCNAYDPVGVENRYRESCGYGRIGTRLQPGSDRASNTLKVEEPVIPLLSTLEPMDLGDDDDEQIKEEGEGDEFGVKVEPLEPAQPVRDTIKSEPPEPAAPVREAPARQRKKSKRSR